MPLRLLRYEYKMMVDPYLGGVPVSRLESAELALFSQTGRGEQVSALTWTERGPSNIGGRTRAILVDAADPGGNTVYAGAVGGGLWKTTNFKSVNPIWTAVNDFFANLAVTCISQNPLNSQEIYFGTGEGFGNIDAIDGRGIWHTANGGANWTQLASTTGISHVLDLEFDNNGYIYASTRSTNSALRGILRSSDNGTNWTQVLTDPNPGITTRGADLERAADGDMYATLGIFSLGHIFRSASNGTNTGIANSWTEITAPGITSNNYQRVEIAVCPGNPNRIYAVAQSGTTYGIGGMYRSDNDGVNWTNLSNASWCDQGASTNADYSRSQAWYDLIMAVDPSNSNTVLSGGVVVVKSTNSGVDWSQATRWTSGATCTNVPVIHADIHEIKFLSSTEIIIATDGGIYYSNDGGASFSNKNNGYNVTQYYGMAMHPAAGNNTMLGGTQDNGSHLFSSAGINNVNTVTGGDGGLCFIDQTNGAIWITANPGGYYNIYRNSGTYLGTGGTGNGRFIGAADYASNLNILYFGDGDGLYGRIINVESGTAQQSLIDVSAEMGNNRQVSCVKVDPADETVIWLGCSDSENNAGAAVTPILLKVIRADGPQNGQPGTTVLATPYAGPALPAGAYISSIDIEPGNSNHLIMTVSNYGVNSVWESTNGGANWTSVEGNLPDMPVRWALFIPAGYHARTQAIGGVLLATELGVWTTPALNGGGTVWSANNSGLANVRVDQLALRSSDNWVGAATHGRGIFTTSLLSALPVTLIDFTGRQQGENIVIDWSTSSEFNSSHFELEKSINGRDFKKITTLQAAGQSTDKKEYRYTDSEVRSEKNYYRLRSVDLDNQYELSDVVFVKIPGKEQKLYVSGNPFRDRISLRLFKEPATGTMLRLIDVNGRQVMQQQFGKGVQVLEWPIPAGRLSSGVYYLQVFTDGHQFTRQMIKQ
ncbi:MAG: T9SS type A sorting domain-containing protein [Chitinophagaceae bacterium]